MRRSGKIILERFRAQGRVGVSAQERSRPQPLLFQITLLGDFYPACLSDSIESSIDYVVVVSLLEQLLAKEEFHLLERLAYRFSEVLFTLEKVKGCIIKVSKPNAFGAKLLPSFELECYLV